jgi:hypothetical protein
MPIAITATVMAERPTLARLSRNGIRSVRITWMTSVCVTSDSTNQPVRKTAARAGSSQPNPNQSTANVSMSKSELTDPRQRMNRAIWPVAHGCGAATSSGSTSSPGIGTWEQS